MKKVYLLFFCWLAIGAVQAQISPTEGNYELAARFSPEKLKKMIFSTSVDAHWLKKSDRFWYEYETTEGKNWYIVNPTTKSKAKLFDNDKLAAEITKVVRDPFDGQHLDISNLKFLEDENTIEFKVKSTQEVLKKDWEEIKAKNRNAKDSLEKKTFVFRYNINSQLLTEITDPEEEAKRLSWANISPDSSKVVFARHHNLYWMDKENFLKAVKDEKDSTIVEHQLTTDGEKDYTYGGWGRGEDNVEEEKNKDKRKRASILWSDNSKQFILTRSDAREVKDLWVIHNTRDPRPTLETYKYAMPGEKEQPIAELYHYSFDTEKLSKLDVNTFKDQTIGLWSKDIPASNRDDDFKPVKWLGDNDYFYFSITSRDLKRIDICRWNIKEGKKEIIVEERSNTYIDISKPEIINNGTEMIHWSERDGWGHFYLYGTDGTLKRQLTSGPYHTESVARVDERARMLYFVANGREKGEDPYYEIGRAHV